VAKKRAITAEVMALKTFNLLVSGYITPCASAG
jgi:hypothetical protein